MASKVPKANAILRRVLLTLCMVALVGCQSKGSAPCETPKPDDERCKLVRAADAPRATPPAASAGTTVPNLPLDTLTPDERALFFSVVDDQFDPCGKPRSFGETLRRFQAECPSALALAQFVVGEVKAERDRSAIVLALIAEMKRIHHRVELRLDGRPRRGPAAPRATLVVFSDFQCPYCREVAPQLVALVEAHPDVALVFKQAPSDGHPVAKDAARAALAASRVGRFWEMHDALFRRGAALDESGILAAARDIGLDLERFAADRVDAEVERLLQEDVEDADRAGVEGTPSFWVDGIEVPYDRLEESLRTQSTKENAKEER